MPIYEYACGACNHEFETIQRFSDDPLTTCPECKKDALAKQMSAAAFHLKGSGWYETDFKTKKDDGGDKKSSDSASKDSSDSGSKTESASTKSDASSSDSSSTSKSSTQSSTDSSASTTKPSKSKD